MATRTSTSLLERRGRALHVSVPALCPVATKKNGHHNDHVAEAYVDSTTASSGSDSGSTSASTPSLSPAVSPQVSPRAIGAKKSSGLVLRRNAFRNLRSKPSINCALVVQDSESHLDPFLHSQCSKLTDEYDGFVKLGEGSCGVVYKVRSRTDNKEVALKVMRMDDEERLGIARKEYELLRQVSHPGIISALDFFTYPMGAVLVLEYFVGKSLAKAVREAPGRRLEEATARHLSSQLLGAVSHLHLHGIIHRDVKADNILVSHDLSDLRLIDFNAAKRLAESQALTMTGTVDYMSPEALQGNSPSEPGDVWALGLCLYLMLDGRLPSELRALRITFGSLDEVSVQQGSLVRLDSEVWDAVSEPCKEVVRGCLKLHCDSRPTASTVLAMTWFTVDSPATVHCGCDGGSA